MLRPLISSILIAVLFVIHFDFGFYKHWTQHALGRKHFDSKCENHRNRPLYISHTCDWLDVDAVNQVNQLNHVEIANLYELMGTGSVQSIVFFVETESGFLGLRIDRTCR